MRVVRIAVIVAVAAVLLGEVAYRFLLQTEFVAAVAAQDPKALDISAAVRFPLTPGLVLHHAATVNLSAHRLGLGSITAGVVTARATGVHLKILQSLASRRADVTSVDRVDFSVTSVDRVDFSADISQDEASRTLPSGYSYVFQADKVILKGPGTTNLVGRLELRAPAQVIFIVPGLQTPPAIALSGYPFADCVQSVTVTAGRATITCTKERPGTDYFPRS